MEVIQTPTPQPTSSSTSSTDNGNTFRPGFLAIMIPFICVIGGAIIGLGVYLFMRRKRSRRKARTTGGDARHSAIRPAEIEEGLNELGDAPPPYELDEARKEHVVVEEVESSSAADAEQSGAVTVTGTPAEPPPAYIAPMAVARTENGFA